jgi:predicted acyl esterase
MRALRTFLFLCLLVTCISNAWSAPTLTEMVPMRDGVRLASDVYLPAGEEEGPWPVVLERTSYGRIHNDDLAPTWLSAGAAYVPQDVRGSHDSEGEHQTFFADGWGEIQDGYDTVEWIASQSWCDGRVITVGGSASAISGLLAAGAAPPSLQGTSSRNGCGDIYEDIVYPGGALRRSLVGGWLTLVGVESRMEDLLAHPRRDAWWDPVLLSNRIGSVRVPILHISGWFDLYADSVMRTASALDTAGGEGARGHQVVCIGPWTHTTPYMAEQGELVFPDNAGSSQELSQIDADFIWETLTGVPTGVFDRPTFLYYLMGDVDDPEAPGNEWFRSDTWPPEESQDVIHHFRADGTLTQAPPIFAEAESTSYVSNPANPLTTVGGRNLFWIAGPMDQAAVEARSDMITFTTPPLENPLAIIGEVRCQLYLSSTAPDADFFIKLTDVYPDGRSILFTEGVTRMRRRNGLDQEDLMTPGEIYQVEISIGHLALVLNEGHRLRFSVASSNSPRFETNPQTGAPIILDDPVVAVATHTVHHDPLHPSHVILPIADLSPLPPDNLPPVAGNVSASLPEDLTISGNVMFNDSDPDGDELRLIHLTQPPHGTVTDIGDGNGTLHYEPDADFHGTDVFTYTASDGRGGTDTASVTLIVNPVNDPPVADDDSDETPEGVAAVIDLLANDSDVDGDALTITEITPPDHGVVENLGQGEVRYTPDPQFAGVDTFTYTVADPSGANDSALVTVTVIPGQNRPPLAADDEISVNENDSVAFDATANDSDPDGDPLQLTAFSQPPHGTVTDIGAGDGNLLYAPDTGFTGTDLFSYTISDGQGGTDSATVTIEVLSANHPPVANDIAITIPANSSIAGNVLDNDTDPDGDPLRLADFTQPDNGTVEDIGGGDGTLRYTPDQGFSGVDTFTYTVADPSGANDSALVTVTVIPDQNRPPLAADDEISVNENDSVAFDATANDSDPDGDPLHLTEFSQPPHGTVTDIGAGDGNLLYEPDTGFTGTDLFSYTVSDGQGGTDSATVTIEVLSANHPPVANDIAITISANSSLSGNVLYNDTDPDGDPLRLADFTQPANGTVEDIGGGDGTLRYTPDQGFTGVNTFIYTVTDGRGGTDTATVKITVR